MKMQIYFIVVLFIPLFSISQTEQKTIYITDNYHNRDCLGGTGLCRESTFHFSNSKTTASIQKFSKNEIEVTLDKSGFKEEEWNDLVQFKIFQISERSIITIDYTVLKALQLETKTIVITPNKYLVFINKNKAIIRIPFSTN